jgi:hypothetical protein
VFSLNATELGTFGVVLCLGRIYHVEHPMGVLRLARVCTRRLCVIESQVTRQTDPLPRHGGTGSARFRPRSASPKNPRTARSHVPLQCLVSFRTRRRS